MSAEKQEPSTSEPGWWRSGLNFTAAVARYIAAGCPNVPESVYNERLRICAQCPLCRNSKCLICGCDLLAKAAMATEKCPASPPRWPSLP